VEEILGITFRVTETFERLGVPYLVGGGKMVIGSD